MVREQRLAHLGFQILQCLSPGRGQSVARSPKNAGRADAQDYLTPVTKCDSTVSPEGSGALGVRVTSRVGALSVSAQVRMANLPALVFLFARSQSRGRLRAYMYQVLVANPELI